MLVQDFFSPGAIEAYKVVGVPLLALIVVVVGIGWRIEVLSKKVDDMKDDQVGCINDLRVETTKSVVTMEGIKEILREMRDIGREKLNMIKEEKEERKVA